MELRHVKAPMDTGVTAASAAPEGAEPPWKRQPNADAERALNRALALRSDPGYRSSEPIRSVMLMLWRTR